MKDEIKSQYTSQKVEDLKLLKLKVQENIGTFVHKDNFSALLDLLITRETSQFDAEINR